MKQCNKCKTPNETKNNFCFNCGMKFKDYIEDTTHNDKTGFKQWVKNLNIYKDDTFYIKNKDIEDFFENGKLNFERLFNFLDSTDKIEIKDRVDFIEGESYYYDRNFCTFKYEGEEFTLSEDGDDISIFYDCDWDK